jgi:hypothetical protein
MKSNRKSSTTVISRFVVTLKSRTDSSSITGIGITAGSAGIGGARDDVKVKEDLL